MTEFEEIYEPIIRRAVRAFWGDPTGPMMEESDPADDKDIRGGKTMDGFCDLIREVVRRNGLPRAEILTSGNATALPGYFRPSKKWDVTVYNGKYLIAAIEFKSMRRAYGKNINNRVEEALGSGSDLEFAYKLGKLRNHPDPFVGYVTLTAITTESITPQREKQVRLGVDPEFDGASYAERYDIICQRLVSSGLYTAAAVLRCDRRQGYVGHFESMSHESSIQNFIMALAERVRTLAQSPAVA